MQRITIGRCPDLSPTEAWAEALKTQHDIAIGLDPWEQRFKEREEPTLGSLANLYVASYAQDKKRSWRDDERRVQIHFRPISGLRISYLNREIVSRWHQRIASERGKFSQFNWSCH